MSTGSVSVEFKTSCISDDGLFLTVEGDDFLNTSNCLTYGQIYYFRVYHSEGAIITITPSAGTITTIGKNYNRLLAETINFPNTNEASLSKLIHSIQSYTWYGRDLGSILRTGSTSIKSTTSGVGVCYISYLTNYDLYSITLSTQSYDSFPVLVYVEAE